MARLDDIAAAIRERFHEALLEAGVDLGYDVLVLERERIVEVMATLRNEFGFAHLSDVTAVDWLPREPRFDLDYHLYAMHENHRLRVKVRLDEGDPRIASITGVWPSADYLEREVYEFFGITFDGHPHLARLFMPDEWIGHPLRKDYPVGGVPVEYRIEPAYVGDRVVSDEGRPAAGGVPGRLSRDRGAPSRWTWTGHPASGVRVPEVPEPPQEPDASSEGKER